MSKPNIKVKGKIQNMDIVDQSEKKVTPKRTNFLLTINTNQSYKNTDPNLKNDIEFFDSVIASVLNSLDQYIKLPVGHTWNDDLIKDVSADYVIERGLQKGHVHTHIFISVTHFTDVKLDYAKIKNKVKTDLGLNNIYMLNKVVKNAGNLSIIQYLEKYT
jgi:hypothetical protein